MVTMLCYRFTAVSTFATTKASPFFANFMPSATTGFKTWSKAWPVTVFAALYTGDTMLDPTKLAAEEA